VVPSEYSFQYFQVVNIYQNHSGVFLDVSDNLESFAPSGQEEYESRNSVIMKVPMTEFERTATVLIKCD